MKGVVIIPTWRRPDFLWATLDRIMKSDAWEDYEYLISIDRDPDPDVLRVARDFWEMLPGNRVRIEHRNHKFSGNSYNVLHAYRHALEIALGHEGALVFLVEEDIFVSRGFFRFHQAAHRAAPHCFGVSACRDQNAPLPAFTMTVDLRVLETFRRSWIYERETYQSLGVSFRPDVVQEILSHVTPDYWEEPCAALKRKFPGSKIPYGQAEQDGLIGRVLEHRLSMDMLSFTDYVHGCYGMIYPIVPRAFHAGFHGSNRSGGRPLHDGDGSTERRGERLLAMTEAELNERADSRYRDIAPCDLETAESDDLTLRIAPA